MRDRGVALRPQFFEFLLQPPHLRPQDGVLLDYSEFCGGDDVTEQGLGHNCNGLSEREGEPGAPDAVGASCGIPSVTGLDTQVNEKTASPPCRGDVMFVTRR